MTIKEIIKDKIQKEIDTVDDKMQKLESLSMYVLDPNWQKELYAKTLLTNLLKQI